MARALVRSIITGVREAMSVSSSTRLAPFETPTIRPTKPRSRSEPGYRPGDAASREPASAKRVLANGPRLSVTTRADDHRDWRIGAQAQQAS
jgi:hypothetical protein